jgi:hypothetical protein
MVEFELLHPRMTREHLGYLPMFLSSDDPRSAREQPVMAAGNGSTAFVSGITTP